MGDEEIGKAQGNFTNYPFLHKLHPKDGKINKMQHTKIKYVQKNSHEQEQQLDRPKIIL
ncbi:MULTISPECIES: hypothetical protein [unclassified Anabaena]|uniref:hypothetical protein n=1 Tax=unclassified Anabaena TaxID=2619674 RepID=UPI0014479415|nr:MULTISPECIES: hypothetical protein [unclassified Anabaena]